MPLIKSRSKKAMSENIETEMKHGKPQKQSIAIAYAVKRKAPKKKMASGGEVSASNEKRPMPENEYNDSQDISHNSKMKPAKEDNWLDNPSVKQASKPKQSPLSRPKLMGSDAFSVRYKDEIDEDLKRMSSEAPASPDEQPSKKYDEIGQDRQGPEISDMQDEHSTHRKPYAKGGMAQGSKTEEIMAKRAAMSPEEKKQRRMDFIKRNTIDKVGESGPAGDAAQALRGLHKEEKDKYAKGGQVEASDYSSPINKYEDDLLDIEPSADEGYENAMSHDEIGQDRQGPKVSDMEEPHNKYESKVYGYARGGEVEMEDDQPQGENAEMDHASLAAAIMARRRRLAHGGKILSHDSIYSDDSDQADLSRNADEDANEEDQSSFNALRKENYSESEGLDQLDSPMDSNEHGDDREDSEENDHDSKVVSAIRRKMRMKSPISR